jgi:hypothetical protein
MASPAQISANRENAQHSTGPRTAEGKAAVAVNAVRHSLTSANIALQGEDLARFRTLVREYHADLRPRTSVENALVEHAAYAEWRLLRIAVWETQIINAAVAGEAAPCMTLFGKSPDDALARLHRYEAQTQRAWHHALREFRVLQKFRQEVEAADDRAAKLARKFSRLPGFARFDQTNPIASPDPVHRAPGTAESHR